MDQAALFAIGIFVGWQWARWWFDKPQPVTWEHKVGASLAASMAAIIERQRFVGSGMVIEKSWTTDTKYGEFEVRLTRRDCAQVIDL